MKTNLAGLVAFLWISIFFITGCPDNAKHIGTYETLDAGGNPVTIELKQNGQGSWATLEDNASFRWECKGDKLFLHAKTGGVITGTIAPGALHISLPGMKILDFEKIN